MYKPMDKIVKESGKDRLRVFVPLWSRCGSPLVHGGATAVVLSLWVEPVSSAPCRKLPVYQEWTAEHVEKFVEPREQALGRKGENWMLYVPQSVGRWLAFWKNKIIICDGCRNHNWISLHKLLASYFPWDKSLSIPQYLIFPWSEFSLALNEFVWWYSLYDDKYSYENINKSVVFFWCCQLPD